MESLLAGKPKMAVTNGLRALLPVFQKHYGNPEGFRVEGGAVVQKEMGDIPGGAEPTGRLLLTLYQQVLRTRAGYFRPIESQAALDSAYRELTARSAEEGPLRQGVLWLGHRLQQAAIQFLNSNRAEPALERYLKAVRERRQGLRNSLGDPGQLDLERIEAVLGELGMEALGDRLERFDVYALAGHVLEQLRRNARRLPERGRGDNDIPEDSDLGALLAALTEPTRFAELNEARARFARLNDTAKSRRYDDFRRRLGQAIDQVAPYAPMGVDAFSQAVEAALFPYPAPLEFVRPFVRPIWNNGRQSTLFNEATTPQGIHQRYETLKQERQVNTLLLEVARAFAMARFQESDEQEKSRFLRDLDLVKEFGWPEHVGALEQLLGPPPRR